MYIKWDFIREKKNPFFEKIEKKINRMQILDAERRWKNRFFNQQLCILGQEFLLFEEKKSFFWERIYSLLLKVC